MGSVKNAYNKKQVFYDKLNNAMYLNKKFTANMTVNQITPDVHQQIPRVTFGHLLIEFKQMDRK